MTTPGLKLFRFIFCYFFVFLVHGYVVNLVTCISLGLLYIFEVVSPGFDFVFSVLVKRLAGESISEMTCFVSSGI